MIAVHFGAGNIGRGFIGQLLHEANFDLVFVDVNPEIVDQLKIQNSYQVIETGAGAKTHTIRNFTALNSQTEFEDAANQISEAEILTTSVGPNVLKFLAPLIVEGLKLRSKSKPLVVMACENAIRATDLLLNELNAIDPAVAEKAVFANTAVDRIVPPQKDGLGLDVLVESFSEWVIDESTLGENCPVIPGADFVTDLAPYIERKLFTVNTSHASLAYLGQRQGAKTIVEASANGEVVSLAREVLAETTKVLISRHKFDESKHREYVEKTLERFRNPDLDDPVTRVGREPARKLARHDRLVGPAAYLSEMNQKPKALLKVIEAALLFEDAADAGVAELQTKLKSSTPEEFVSAVMGISEPHPLAIELTGLVKQVKLKNYS